MKIYAVPQKLTPLNKLKPKRPKRKVKPKQPKRLTERTFELVFVIDDSGSTDSHKDDARACLGVTLEYLQTHAPRTRTSVVPFSWRNMSRGGKALRVRVPAYRIGALGIPADGSTEFRDGVLKGVECAMKSPKSSRIFYILLSDGDTCEAGCETSAALNQMRSERETICLLVPLNSNKTAWNADMNKAFLRANFGAATVGKTTKESQKKIVATIQKFI